MQEPMASFKDKEIFCEPNFPVRLEAPGPKPPKVTDHDVALRCLCHTFDGSRHDSYSHLQMSKEVSDSICESNKDFKSCL